MNGASWYGKASDRNAPFNGVAEGIEELELMAEDDPEIPDASGRTYAHANLDPEDPVLLMQLSTHQRNTRLRRLTARHELLARLVASGASDDEIIRTVGRYSKVRLYQIRKSPRFIQRVTELQEEMIGKNLTQRFSRIGGEAVAVAEELLRDRNTTPALRYKVAHDFMDRAYGKAKETLEVEHNTVSDLFDALDKLRRGTIDRLPSDLAAQVAGTPAPHPIDTAIEALVPESSGIAARTSESSE